MRRVLERIEVRRAHHGLEALGSSSSQRANHRQLLEKASERQREREKKRAGISELLLGAVTVTVIKRKSVRAR